MTDTDPAAQVRAAAESIDSTIRQRAGHAPAQPVRPAEVEGLTDAEAACVAHGLSPRSARWIKGETPEELAADALAMAVELGRSGVAEELLPVATDFDAGFRGVPWPPPAPAPTLDDLIRGGLAQKREDAAGYVDQARADRETQ